MQVVTPLGFGIAAAVRTLHPLFNNKLLRLKAACMNRPAHERGLPACAEFGVFLGQDQHGHAWRGKRGVNVLDRAVIIRLDQRISALRIAALERFYAAQFIRDRCVFEPLLAGQFHIGARAAFSTDHIRYSAKVRVILGHERIFIET